MSGWYRFGAPGEDTIAHVNTGSKASAEPCRAPRFERDNPGFIRDGRCGRMSVVLCDWPGCDIPICSLHRTKHPVKPNTDYCDDHKCAAVQFPEHQPAPRTGAQGGKS